MGDERCLTVGSVWNASGRLLDRRIAEAHGYWSCKTGNAAASNVAASPNGLEAM
jgi:hypothetical protein